MNMNKNIKIVVFLVFLIIIGFIFVNNKVLEKIEIKREINKLEKEIKSHYSSIVMVSDDASLYTYDDGEYTQLGVIKKGEIINIETKKITSEDVFFKIKGFDGSYYIKYQDVFPTKKVFVGNKRWQHYIPFNESIMTNDYVNFYDQDDKLVYGINKHLLLPIMVKYDNGYGVIYNDRLLMVRKEDVREIVNSSNTDEIATSEIAVLNYHFFYDETEESERKECNQRICQPISLFSSHLKYIKDNNIFTPTMEEYELWYDEKINLPKSVLITIDDGWRMQQGIDLLEKYQLNATVFLITSWFKDKIKFLHNYQHVEFHSHGDNIHNSGECPGGQGGAIKCASKERLLNDLALSRKKLEGSPYFCYPFYEYNNYAIDILKEAGFTMAFANGGRSTRDSNRYAIPRYVIYNNTSVSLLESYIG